MNWARSFLFAPLSPPHPPTHPHAQQHRSNDDVHLPVDDFRNGHFYHHHAGTHEDSLGRARHRRRQSERQSKQNPGLGRKVLGALSSTHDGVFLPRPSSKHRVGRQPFWRRGGRAWGVAVGSGYGPWSVLGRDERWPWELHCQRPHRSYLRVHQPVLHGTFLGCGGGMMWGGFLVVGLGGGERGGGAPSAVYSLG